MITGDKIESTALYQGVKSALPVILGYFPLAFAYGVLAVQAGLSVAWTVGMSVLVYAGAGQFIAVAMLAAGADSLAIVITVFVVNLRHLLMSASIAPKLGHLSRFRAAAVAFDLTDETFAVISLQDGSQRLSSGWLAGLQWCSHLSWISGSALGAVAGAAVTNPSRWGLDFALVAMFIALLAMQVRHRTTLVAAITAAIIYRFSLALVNDHWAVIIAAAVAATVGTMLSDRKPAESPQPVVDEEVAIGE